MNALFDPVPRQTRHSKIVSLPEAISSINDGDVIMLGLIDTRRPMAAAYEIVRQQKGV